MVKKTFRFIAKVTVAVLISVLLINIGSAGLLDSPWPKFQGNNQNTGQSNYSSNSDGTLKWKTVVGTGIGGSVVIGSGNVLYAGSHDGKLYAIDSKGRILWSYDTGSYIETTPLILSGELIYVASINGKISVLYSNGSLKWNYTVSGSIYSSPAAADDGTFYVATYSPPILYALNPNGTLKWTYNADRAIYRDIAVDYAGVVYIPAGDRVYPINPDGSAKTDPNDPWQRQLIFYGAELFNSPVIDINSSRLYITERAGSTATIWAYDLNGTYLWDYYIVGVRFNTPSLSSSGVLYVTSPTNGKLYALNPNGTLRWTYDAGSPIYSPVAIGADGRIYFGSDNNVMHAVNPDGTVAWNYNKAINPGMGVYYAPSIGSNGAIYFPSEDAYLLYAFRP